MTRTTHDDAAIDAALLPLVSIIITNYNYATWLPAAVEAVMNQTYEAIECVVVDDASSDGSRETIGALQARYPKLRAILLETNVGCLRASFDGLAATSGHFVHFMDADDLILPTFIETHVAAQLSLRFPVGFTCCDMMMSCIDGTAVTCGDTNVSGYLREKVCRPAERRRLPPHLAGRLGALDGIALYKVHPSFPGWPWSATSAVVYRRRALLFFTTLADLQRVKASNDTLFCQAVHAITGSAIIDAPLAIYRLHGSNVHFASTPLDQLVSFDKHKLKARQAATMEVLIEHVVANAAMFAAQTWDDRKLLDLIGRLAIRHPGKPTRREVVKRHGSALAAVLGWPTTLKWMMHVG